MNAPWPNFSIWLSSSSTPPLKPPLAPAIRSYGSGGGGAASASASQGSRGGGGLSRIDPPASAKRARAVPMPAGLFSAGCNGNRTSSVPAT